MVLLADRHGLELVDLRWAQIDFKRRAGVRRAKKGTQHTSRPGDELRALPSLPARDPASLRIHVRTPCAVHDGGLRQDGGAGRRGPASSSRPTLTCSATPAASPSPTPAMIRDRCRPIWAT